MKEHRASYAEILQHLPRSTGRGNCLAVSKRHSGYSSKIRHLAAGPCIAINSTCPTQSLRAQQAEVVSEATSLLSRVENLMQESEKIAAEAKIEENWSAATSALREARSCLELLGKLRGELQQADTVHLHKHAHLHAAGVPTSASELELEIARRVSEATDNFHPAEIARLRSLVEGAEQLADPISESSSMPATGMRP
jgi:hypothetical protein